MIYFRHKETGFIISYKDLKKKYREIENDGVVTLNTIIPNKFTYRLLDIPFNEDFEILEVDENLEATDYIRLLNILENSIITDKKLIEKITPVIYRKIEIENILKNF